MMMKAMAKMDTPNILTQGDGDARTAGASGYLYPSPKINGHDSGTHEDWRYYYHNHIFGLCFRPKFQGLSPENLP